MSEIVNLRRARKAKGRADAAAKAGANRLLHGRTRGDKLRQAAEAEGIRRVLDGARLDRRGAPDEADIARGD